MTMIESRNPAAPGATAAALFHGLADPTRLLILEHLRTGEHKVKELTDHLGLAQSTVSAHLSCLRECGLVSSRPAGRASLYFLADAEGLSAVLLAAAVLTGTDGTDAGSHGWSERHGSDGER
ncbi:ArsR/SmtB family transcription factor [Paeniglutamicibacter cryotolerans]|uniref:DNA-binding transcriptional ArsR family regulator n=1 Tax=Paeniglutamicibacter cryotolerans TaxID=670079 RepID=A0A839QLN9_9MICC|nr:metalloregulator ArsR/SmtB family transcription factor [Paeniglutamicibacter cryotolerans]MBB2995515.1 DNA-binding transcriptional ArsR family regulator [Paeniglutamicibacter cryotolerans]